LLPLRLYALDRHGSSVIRRKKAKFSHNTSWRVLDADFLNQKLSRDGEKHFGTLSPFLNNLSPRRYLPSVMNGLSHSIDMSPRVACLLDELEHLTETNGIYR
jgi:hypothetical protein